MSEDKNNAQRIGGNGYVARRPSDYGMRVFVNGYDINSPPPDLVAKEALKDLLATIDSHALTIGQTREVIEEMIAEPYKKASDIVNERG